MPPPLILLAILMLMPNGTYQQVNPWVNSYGIVTYPLNYAVVYRHVLGSGTYIMYLPPGGYYSIPISGPEYLGLYLQADSNVTIQLLNQTAYHEFEKGVGYQPLVTLVTSSINTTVYIPQGVYYIVVVNNNSSVVNAVLILTRHYQAALANAPIGVVDYGLAPTIGGYVPYSYTTTEFLGSAVIREVNTTAITKCPPLPPDSFSLQLNAVLELGVDNHTQYYWLQNVVIIDPGTRQLLPLVNVWNISAAPPVMNPLYVVGHGAVINNTVYAYMGNWTPYEAPLAVNLTISVGRTTSGFPDALFIDSIDGYSELIDNVTLLLRPTWGPYLAVNGSEYSPSGYLIDVEFVVSGPGCGAVVYADNISAELSLYYLGPNNELLPVPTTWSFGSDTGETIINVKDEAAGAGAVLLTSGGEYLGPLPSADYVNFVTLNDYLLNGTLISTSIPIPEGSWVLLITNRTVNLGNGTLLRLVGTWVDDVFTNNTAIKLFMNEPHVVNYEWARYYWFQVIDASGKLTNMSNWYLADSIINITVPKTTVYLNDDARLVFSGFQTNATHYLINGNSIVLLIDSPTQLVVNWAREFNVSLIIYSINNTPIITEHLGWLPAGYKIRSVSINGINYTLQKPIYVTGPELTAVINANYAQFTVKDLLGLPEPLTRVSIRCDGQVMSVVTNMLGETPRILLPVNSTCSVTVQPLGYYSIALITALAMAITVSLLRVVLRR